MAEVGQQEGIADILRELENEKEFDTNNRIFYLNDDPSCGHYWISARILLLCLGDHPDLSLEDNNKRKVMICYILQ